MLQQYIGIGPVQARVLAMLRDYAEGDFAISIAERSPLGTRAVRVRPTGDPDGSPSVACQDLARWLESQPGVEAVTARPPHVYVRVSTDALRSWVAAGFAGHSPARGEESSGRLVVVRFVDAVPPRPLELFREAAVGRAVAALLASRGYDVRLDPVVTPHEVTAAPPALRGAVKIAAHPVGGASAKDDGDVVQAPVGGVDVPHGPLRARHGGTVSADDLLGEIRDGPLAENGLGHAVGSGPTSWSDRYAEALLAFVLLRTERARRIQLDDAKLRGESAAFDSVLAARRIADASAGPPETADAGPLAGAGSSERAVRDLAVELDLLPPVAARAATELEPALLARYVRSLADRTHAASAYLPAADPLWPAVGDAIDIALALVGIDVPPRVWQATPAEVQGSRACGRGAHVPGTRGYDGYDGYERRHQ